MKTRLNSVGFFLFSKEKAKKKGIALAFSLVLLSLLLVIGVSFIILASNDRASSAASTNARRARNLGDVGINRAKLHLLQELRLRAESDERLGGPVPDMYYSLAPKAEKALISNQTALQEDLNRVLINGAEALGVQWNYITSPDIFGSAAFNSNKEKRRILGRVAYLAFAGAKVSPSAILDTAWSAEDPPPRVGFSPRELRLDAALDVDMGTVLPTLAPRTSEYLGAGENKTEEWPDISAIAKSLNYTTGNQLITLYQRLALGKLPAPEMWRMSPHSESPFRAMHRFNLFKSATEWRHFDIEKNSKLTIDDYSWVKNNGTVSNVDVADEDVGLYFFNAGKANGDLPPGFTEETLRKQFLANLKDYNDRDFTSTTNLGETLNVSSLNNVNIEYAGLERVPYFSNVLLAFSFIVNGSDGSFTGPAPYDVTFSLDNFACEMHNMYENPDIRIENVQLAFDIDVKAETSLGEQCYFELRGQVVTDMNMNTATGLGQKVYKGRKPQYYVNDQLRSYDSNPKETGPEGVLQQPYFIVSATRGLGQWYQSQSLGSKPTLTRIIFKKVTATIAGDVAYKDENGKEIVESGRILNVARCTTLDNQFIRTYNFSGNKSVENQYWATCAFSNDDMRPQVVPMKIANADWTNGRDFYWEISNRTIGNWLTVCANGLCAFCKKEKYKTNTEQGYYDAEPYGAGKNGPYSEGHCCWASTAFIRNAPMVSPWELGFIHRVRSYQTINLKRYNAKSPDYMDMSEEGYRLGDAAILDQVKFTKDKISYGKVNINTANDQVIRALVKDMKSGTMPAYYSEGKFPKEGFDKHKNAPQFPSKTIPFIENNIVTNEDPTAYSENRDITQLKGSEFDGLMKEYFKTTEKGPKGDDEQLDQWWSRARIVNVLEPYLKEVYDISNVHDIPDADYEELIGKFVGLLECESAREVTVIVAAQAIEDAKNSNGEFGTYEPGGDRIVGSTKLLATFEYWPKLTPVSDNDRVEDEYLKGNWVLTRLVELESAFGGLE